MFDELSQLECGLKVSLGHGEFILSYRQFYRASSILLLLLIPQFFASQLWSAQTNATTETDFFGDAPLILTASRMSKPLLEAPATVSVIDRKTIESSGAREIAELFRLIPGFIVGYLNGNTPVVSYQGLGSQYSRQTQVLIDGRSAFIPSFGGVSWANLPLLIEDIERIEVIRGPNAVTYGANAFLATINIITRHAAEDFGTRYSVTSSDNANPNIKGGYVRHGYHNGDLDWRLSASTSNDDGFRDVHDSKTINKISFRLDQASQNNQFWTFQIGSSDNTSETGRPNRLTNSEREFEATNSFFTLQWEKIRNVSSTIIKLSHTQQKVADRHDPSPVTVSGVPGINTIIDLSRESQRSDIEITQTEELSTKLRLVYGANFRHDTVQSILITNDNEVHSIDSSRLFSGVEWRVNGDWLLDFGASVEESTLSDLKISPRLSIIRTLSNRHALRFVASKANRNPILYEHSGLTIFSGTAPGIGTFDVKTLEGNPNLKPESITSYEIGLRSQLLAPHITSDIKLFSYEITDHIVELLSVEIHPILGPENFTTYSNQGLTKVKGIELSFDYAPTQSLEFKSGISAIDVDSNQVEISRSFAERTGFIHTLYHWNDRHDTSATFYYMDKIRWREGASARPSFEKLDLRYAYLISRSNETKIELIGQNLLESYADYRVENIAEKTFLLRVSGGF